ncbi:electron transfer flavoprotein subunit beta [Saccharospirillum mangrovi]|uniref:electron transfer flavoprotein subunit beta n=1 Tax=Saccharospirillum mangrovi TaxID=2161747 RepID=UPI000D34C292|nr:electron transfer flavoprotein subunit beta [Saccharospirillum mangrovi]
MSPDQNLRITTLVSIGQHEKSGREQRAAQDARALEMGLKLAGTDVQVLHVGPSGEPALKQYLGMGLPQLTQLKANPESDVTTILADYLSQHPSDILLTGIRSETGEASGLLPYQLAEKLGWPLVDRIADVQSITNGKAEILQALPRGQRRLIRVTLPFVATVDMAAPAPRQSAFGAARRATIDEQAITAPIDETRQDWQQTPAKAKPKRLNVVKAKNAADRFKAATAKPAGQGGQVIKDGTDREKAEIILELLKSEELATNR